MIKPDVIVAWPNNVDYPLWRQFIRVNRHRFGKVIIGFTETHIYPKYTDFVVSAMMSDDVTFFNSPTPTGGSDWRNLAVNKALQFVTSDWVWFTEQDFFITSDEFWAEVDRRYDKFEAIGIYQADRLHPCCLFVKRSEIWKTRRNFGIVPNVSDHFSMFAEDLKNNDVLVAKLSPENYYHYNGMSSNFTLLANGSLPNYEPEEFKRYMINCLSVRVPISPEFRKLAERLLPQNVQK